MTVTFTYKNGRERRMTRQEAEVLRRLGYGQYMTKDMRAAPSAQSEAAAGAPVVQEPAAPDGSQTPSADEAAEQADAGTTKKPRGRSGKPKPESEQ